MRREKQSRFSWGLGIGDWGLVAGGWWLVTGGWLRISRDYEARAQTGRKSRARGIQLGSYPRLPLACPRPSRISFPLKCALSTRFAGSAFSPTFGIGPL